MADEEPNSRRASEGTWRIAGWSMAALLLLLPLAAMQFTDEVNWTATDFVLAGVLICSAGTAFELTVRMSDDGGYRAGIALALAATVLTVWINGAVGLIGSERDWFNLAFAAVPAVALLGAVVARFRPQGMARAMAAAAIAQLLASGIGLVTDLRGGILSATLAALWLLSARWFGKAASD